MAAPPPRLALADRVVLLVVASTVLGLGALVAVAHTGIEALSAMRAYVAGEARWSKAQKDAVHYLYRYATLGADAEYERFLAELRVPLELRRAREALEAPEPDREAARERLLSAEVHPDDVDPKIRFFVRYRRVPHVDRAISVWEEADVGIDELLGLGERIRLAHAADTIDGPGVAMLLEELASVNARLTLLEAEFSRVFGDAARWTRGALIALVSSFSVILLVLIAAVTWFVTRRLKRSQASLADSEARYRALYENSPFGVYRSSVDGRILSANPALVQMLGYRSVDDLTRLDLARDVYVDPAMRSDLVRRTLEGERDLLNHEVEWRRADGTVVLVRLNGRMVLGADGVPQGYEMFAEDVTGRRSLEGQLRQSQKMEALGQLTGGIAHDFNNLLTVILAASHLLQESLDHDSGAPEELEEIRDAALRGAEMVRKLLAFARRGTLMVRATDLAELLDGTFGMLRRVLPTSIEMEVSVPDGLPPVLADHGAVEQILLNLATNARDAMPDGGTIALTAEPVPAGRPGLPAAVPKGVVHVCLEVRDSGEGMSPEVLDRIFEPFFTTKPTGTGTGLGLPMVYGLAWQQGAVVDVESESGVGTRVRLYFRTAEAGAGVAARWDARTPRAAADGTAARRIALDVRAAPTRDALEGVLEAAGYHVLVVSDSEDEIGPVDLVIRDVYDPREQKTDPAGGVKKGASMPEAEAPVLLLGGFSAADAEPDTSEARDRVSVLHHPWTAAELLRRVQRLLG